MAQARSAREKRGFFLLAVRTEKNEVIKIFIISLDSNRRGKDFSVSGTASDD